MSIALEVQARRRMPTPAMAREIRRAAGVSQERLARELGVTRITIARWELGTRRPRGDLMVRYGQLLEEIREASAA